MKQGFGLGKGIGALIPKDLIKQERTSQPSLSDGSGSNEGAGVALIPIDKIIGVNPMQPRQEFDQAKLDELTRSIMVHGVITPITVRKHFDGYELVSGERRVRASRNAGLTEIPAYVIEVSTNAEMLEIALIENVQRENLNPLETAQGYQLLMEECGLKQEDVAVRVGKDRSTVANMLRLLKLPPDAQAELRAGTITMGHARALLALSSERNQIAVLREICSQELSVRKTEALVKDIELGRKEVGKNGVIRKSENPSRNRRSDSISRDTALHPTLADIENSLRHILGTQVQVKMKTDEQGSIDIAFYSLEEFERLIELFATLSDTEPS